MKNREFNKHLNACCRKVEGEKTLDLEKLRALPTETKVAMGMYIVRSRGPVLAEFADHMDRAWLAGMGYLHRTTNAGGFTFVHRLEDNVKPAPAATATT
jgi:hypothetical protein